MSNPFEWSEDEQLLDSDAEGLEEAAAERGAEAESSAEAAEMSTEQDEREPAGWQDADLGKEPAVAPQEAVEQQERDAPADETEQVAAEAVMGEQEAAQPEAESEAVGVMQTSAASGKLSAEDRDSILQSIDQIKQKLSYAAQLSEQRRRRLFHIGEDGRQFVAKALQLATQNAGILPRAFDVEEFQRDAELLEALRPISEEVGKLADMIEVLMEAAGSDAFSAALAVYQAAKVARQGEELDQFLAGPRRE